MNALEDIITSKRRELKERIRPIKDRELDRLAQMQRMSCRFSEALQQAEGIAVIAEIKRRSPSAGNLAEPSLQAVEQACLYINGGVDALSVLTDNPYFGGHLRDLWDVVDFLERRRRATPCLCKDFFVHPLQVVEAAEAGARAILIIVRALSTDEVKALYETASWVGLDSIFEIHTEAELERALTHEARIIGVNNRDLSNFTLDLTLSEKMIPKIPKDIVAISESGIRTYEDVEHLYQAGAQAVLIGETLMKAVDPAKWIATLKAHLTDRSPDIL